MQNERLKVTDIITKAIFFQKTEVSFEILPPHRGNGIQTVFNHLEPIMRFKPPFINVTYHRREIIDVLDERGNIMIKKGSRRPGTVGICAAIQQRYNVKSVIHLLCGGFTKEETEDALIELSYLGVNNIFALRGDALKSDKGVFVPAPGGHHYAIDLVKQIKNLNKGIYVDNSVSEGVNMDFCIGVAGYPEKHLEAPSFEEDLMRLKQKVDAGGEYIITQMFFDNEKFFSFIEACRSVGINVPIIPGLKPIMRKRHLRALPESFSIHIPEALSKEIMKCKDDEQCAEVGLEWMLHQTLELKKKGIPIIHYYTLGGSSFIARCLEKAF